MSDQPEPITVTGPDADLVRALLSDPHRNDHILQIDDTGWTLQHPVIERVTGDLFSCQISGNANLLGAAWDDDGNAEGRYRVWLEGDDESLELGMERIAKS
jgi:hypothetical protein